jgi:hypothetical protein
MTDAWLTVAAVLPAWLFLFMLAAVSGDAGLTVAELAKRYRVGEDKVRAWIARGELAAINTAAVLCGKPRWVVTAEALAAFERRRAAPAPTPRPARKRKKRQEVDYYPD